jgi:hypothetical protein
MSKNRGVSPTSINTKIQDKKAKQNSKPTQAKPKMYIKKKLF